jgi:hypothetical protein
MLIIAGNHDATVEYNINPLKTHEEVYAMKKAKPVPKQPTRAMETSVDDFLASFSPLERKDAEIRKGTMLPAHVDIYPPAFGYSSAEAGEMARTAADERPLPSFQFGALRVRFSEKEKALLCIPEAVYDENDPNLFRVIWSKDGQEWRADLAAGLVPVQWETPKGMFRRVPVTLRRNLPKIGTALFLDLRSSELHEAPVKSSKKKPAEPAPAESTTAKAEAAAKAAVAEQMATAKAVEPKSEGGKA